MAGSVKIVGSKLYYLQSAYRLWQQMARAGSCAASAGVTQCHNNTLSRRLCVTRRCHTGKAGVIVITDQCIDRRLLWGGDNARLQRIIHLLNRLSGFISVTCPGSRVQHLPRDTCPADDLQRCNRWLCAALCTGPASWQPHVWADDKAHWYENWNFWIILMLVDIDFKVDILSILIAYWVMVMISVWLL